MRSIAQIRSETFTGYNAVAASLVGAAFTAACAQVVFHLPGNPVPVTLQVFAVVCCGLILGSRLGAIAQMEYLTAVLLGLPVFAGFKAGPAALFGPTGGYLIGFIGAAFVVGLWMEMSARRAFQVACVAGLLGVAVIYVVGAGWLSVWLRIFGGESIVWSTWALGVAPFVGVDVAKVALAATICAGRRCG